MSTITLTPAELVGVVLAARLASDVLILLVRKAYRAELDIRIERRVAHLIGWHSDGCRGFEKCWPERRRTTFRGRWWR